MHEAVHADPRETFGRPGSHAPHLWIEKDGKRVSNSYEQERRPAGKFTVKQAYTRYVRRSAARRAASDRQFQITPAKLQISRLEVVRRLNTQLFKIGGKPLVRAFTTKLKKMR